MILARPSYFLKRVGGIKFFAFNAVQYPGEYKSNLIRKVSNYSDFAKFIDLSSLNNFGEYVVYQLLYCVSVIKGCANINFQTT